MIFRLLAQNEKLFALSSLAQIGRLDHLISPGADLRIVADRAAKLRIVGAFNGRRLEFVYWTYRQDEQTKRRYIAVGALRQLDRPMLRAMRHVTRHLTLEWELWGEIDADNPRGVKLAKLCGFTVAGRSDDKIIVKHERSIGNG